MALVSLQEAINRARDYAHRGHITEARDIIHQILQSFPEHVGAYCLLADIAAYIGQNDLAVTHARRAIQLQPDCAEAYGLLGKASCNLNLLEEAIAAHEKAVALNPTNGALFCLLGAAYWRACLMPQAYKAFQRALAIDASNHAAHTDLVLTAIHTFADDPQRIFAAHRAWAQAHAEPLAPTIRPHTNHPDPDRPLRIGYLSAVFREGAVAVFLEPLLAAHERSQFQIICYCTAPTPPPPDDHAAVRLRTYFHLWRDVPWHNDEQLTELIRNDAIDILVDLAGFTWGNRLLVFARQPAPVQVTYLGYQDTTGLANIHYRFSDAYADPPGMTQQYFSEKIVRLPDTGYCYRANDQCPQVSPLPALANGYITFGSTNRVSKMTPETIAWWSRVLHNVPHSKMLIRSDGLSLPMLQRMVRDQFVHHGIAPERLELLGWCTFRDYLDTFRHIDMVLDCYPFTGHTVSCHALWMGVPVVSRVGTTHTARMGLSILSNLGLPELTASTSEHVVAIATELAQDLPRLAQLRATLRARMQASPLMDQAAFSKHIASAYRQMWRTWCQTRDPAPLPHS